MRLRPRPLTSDGSRQDTAADGSLDDALGREALGTVLHQRSTRGATLTLGAQWARLALQIGATAVLARLLTPDDYGVVGMAAAITGLAELVTGLGLSQATIQRQKVTQAQVSLLFWVNAGIGVGVGVAVAASAPLVADFYGRSELVGVTRVLALAFLLAGLTVQHQALLGRSMRYGAIAIVDISSIAAGIAVALIVAALNGGYWALVGMNLATGLVRLVMVWRMSEWQPSRPAWAVGAGSMLSFGGNLSIFALLNYASRNVDNVLLGRQWGAESLGLYAKAYHLLLLPLQQLNQPLSRVALPTLSYLQSDPARYRRYYRTAIGGIAFVAMPAIMLMSVLSEEVVLALLGEQWLAAARIFEILAFVGVAQTVANANGWIYVSTGHTGRQARWALVSRPLIVLSFVVGLPWGPEGVALSYAVANYLLLLPGFAIAVHGTPLRLADIGGATWRPVVLAACVYVTSRGMHGLVADEGWWTTVGATTLAGATAAAAAVVIVPGTRTQVRALYQAVRGGLRADGAADVGGT